MLLSPRPDGPLTHFASPRGEKGRLDFFLCSSADHISRKHSDRCRNHLIGRMFQVSEAGISAAAGGGLWQQEEVRQRERFLLQVVGLFDITGKTEAVELSCLAGRSTVAARFGPESGKHLHTLGAQVSSPTVEKPRTGTPREYLRAACGYFTLSTCRLLPLSLPETVTFSPTLSLTASGL